MANTNAQHFSLLTLKTPIILYVTKEITDNTDLFRYRHIIVEYNYNFMTKHEDKKDNYIIGAVEFRHDKLGHEITDCVFFEPIVYEYNTTPFHQREKKEQPLFRQKLTQKMLEDLQLRYKTIVNKV